VAGRGLLYVRAAGVGSGALSSYVVENARQQWKAGHRRFEEEARDPARRLRLLGHLETISDELRKRIGSTFTLAELADVYAGAEDWVREALAEAGAPGWPRDLALVSDEAFHLYARGATDYRP
jgi:hypothetical protein